MGGDMTLQTPLHREKCYYQITQALKKTRLFVQFGFDNKHFSQRWATLHICTQESASVPEFHVALQTLTKTGVSQKP